MSKITTFTGITLKRMQEALLDFKNSDAIFKTSKNSQEYFIDVFFPKDFTEKSPFTSAFRKYPSSPNSTMSKIFNGHEITNKLKTSIISYFSNDTEHWMNEIQQCTNFIDQSCMSISRLQQYLEETVFADADKYLISEDVNKIRYLCRHDVGHALAISLFYVLMHGDVHFLMELDGIPLCYNIPTICLDYLKNTIQIAWKTPEAFEELYQRYSALFSKIISKISHSGMASADECTLDHLLELIQKTSTQYVLKIIGATGTEKNTVSQMLFLRMIAHSKENKHLPFYISIHKIVLEMKRQPDYLEKVLKPAVDQYLQICEQDRSMVPVVFVDDLVEYDWGNECPASKPHIDHQIYDLFAQSSIGNYIKYVISIDQGFPENHERNRKYIPFDSHSYNHVVQTCPISLGDKKHFCSVLELFHEIYGIHSNSIEDFYQILQGFHLASVDLYQIRFLDRVLTGRNDTLTIPEIFQFEIERRLHISSNELSQTAKFAYEFAYGSVPVEEDSNTANIRELMYHHKCFVEYLIAYYYLSSLSSVTSVQDIHNVVLPKGITFFIVHILNNNPLIGKNVIDFCEKYYQNLEVHGRSQIAYLLGRIRLPELEDKALQRLLELNEQENKLFIQERDHLTEAEVRRRLFLIRSLSISLIYRKQKNVAEQYLCGLLSDDCANDINRGFHLEYYGDIAYNPSLLILNYSDNIRVGNRAISRLLLTLEHSIDSIGESLSFDLNMLSLCSLLQARMFSGCKEAMNVESAAKRTERLLAEYISHNVFICDKLKFYFYFMLKEIRRLLQSQQDDIDNAAARLFNTLFKANTIQRKGWIKRQIPDPENIVEHTYTAWQIGLLFLPQTHSTPSYNKQNILNMLLIHDLGEVVVDDATPAEDSRVRRIEEDSVMRHFFLTGTYPENANLDAYYELWDAWHAQDSICAQIAKDIDEIQCCYQLCIYHLQYPECLSLTDVMNWIGNYKFRTSIGKEILEKLIYQNKMFQAIFA